MCTYIMWSIPKNIAVKKMIQFYSLEEMRMAQQKQAEERQRLEQEKMAQLELERQALLRQQQQHQAWLQQQHSVTSHLVPAAVRQQSGPSLLQIQQEEEAQALEQVSTYTI